MYFASKKNNGIMYMCMMKRPENCFVNGIVCPA